jgi:hypothetical protein
MNGSVGLRHSVMLKNITQRSRISIARDTLKVKTSMRKRAKGSEFRIELEKLNALPDFCFCVSVRQETKVNGGKISTIKKWHPFL